jgi:endonuclease/exonuclease/phosphatase family metal-dependent hydrolase
VLASLESFFHRLRRQLSRSEWAVRRLGLPVAMDSGEKPGLLLLSFEGMSLPALEAALADGRLPFVQRLRDREGYHLHPVSPDPNQEGSPLPNADWTGLAAEDSLRESHALLKRGRSEARNAPLMAARMDLVRGLPVVLVKFNATAEIASLRNLDHDVHVLTHEAHRSQRRDYHVWLCTGPTTRQGTDRKTAPGFLLLPPATLLSHDVGSEVRFSDLRAAALALLGRKRSSPSLATPPGRLVVMSYNVHSCIGTDGRISPRRIARVIARQHADLIALQELDHGRPRSRAEDQAGEIAEELGFHLLFCPAVVRGDERYGHALLSRWPLDAVKIDALPSHPGGLWPEPRAAIWARARLPDATLNILSTHLGLAAPERLKQMSAILGSEWLGPVLDREPVILCGDFNLTPGSAAHRLAASRLRDVAHAFKRGVPTFSSLRLIAQLDHIFVSTHFGLESVFAAQNDLTRVASDHLPLIAHLRLPGK